MNKELIIRSHSSAVDFALLKDGKLIELNKEVEDNKFSVGDIFVGKIRKAIPGLNAAFIDVGHEKDGFLHYHDLGPKLPSLVKYIKQISTGKNKDYLLKQFRYENDIDKDGNIGDILSPKQTVLVQVVKEPISTKGPRLSSEISLAGRYMVLMPFSDRVSISQKIEDRAEKNRLKKLVQSIRPKGFGLIIRTVAEGQKVAGLDADIQQLLTRWKNLSAKLKQIDKYPAKVLSEINRSSSILRDIFDDNFTGIHVDDAEMQIEIQDYIETIAPDKKSIVKLYDNHLPIFEKFGIERQIKSAFGTTVSMSKGAYLVIEHTEALHVIDVNSGNRSNRSKSQEQTALEVNMISATEIARQLRLRDMGGIIVVDFIDLNSNENRKKLFEHLSEEMSTDRTKHKILPPSRFGLIQITRQRVRPEMNIKTKEPNPNQNGEVEAPIILIDKINTELSKITMNKRNQKEKIHLHVHPFIAAYLLSGIPSKRLKWYFEYKKWIRIVPRHAYQYLEFRFLNKERRRLRN
ncbi:MAG: Rne/Rng family ribonuclease [Flavobacteriaceae bacterium]|nr:Rne/Rng family ribonuclease [Flavobacteriaceae bacterium]